MKKILLILWQLPQVVLGLVVLAFIWKKRTEVYRTTGNDGWVVEVALPIGVSFGPLIILCDCAGHNSLMHEYGHSRQSRILGPLYLLLVGLPSFLRAGWWMVWRLPHEAYYKGYPERWADRLGGVTR